MDAWNVSSRDLWILLLRHRWGATTIIAVTMLALAFWLFFIREDTFDTEAKILVRIGNEQASPANMRKSSVLVTGDRMQDVNSEADILQSSDLIDQVITDLKLDQPMPPKPVPVKLLPRIKYEVKKIVGAIREWRDGLMIAAGLKEALTPRERAHIQFRSALLVTPEHNSNILTVHLFVAQREYGAPLLNRLLELYAGFRLKSYRAQGASAFFGKEADRYASELKVAEEALRKFEEASNFSAVEKQKEVLLEQIATNQTEQNDDLIELRELKAKLARTLEQAKRDDPDIAAIGSFTNHAFPESLLNQLAGLQAERQRMRLTELDSGPRIRNNREQFHTALDMVRSNLAAMIADRQASHDRRAQIVAGLQTQVRTLQDREVEWGALKRRIKILEDSYLDFRKRYEENAASAVMEEQKIGNISIIQHAMAPTQPTGMSKVRLLMLGFLFSLIAAVAWIGVANFFDNRVHTSADVEKHTGAPPLEVVPMLRRRYRFGVWRSYREGHEFRRVAWLLANSFSERGAVVQFTSANRGEGVTTSACGVAEHLAKVEKLKPLVVELDQQAPTLLKRWSIHEDRSLNSYAPGGDATASIYTSDEGVAVAGVRKAEDGGRIDPATLEAFLSAVKSEYDFILLDGPPLSDPDTLAFSALAGSVVLVTASGSTNARVLERGKQELIAKRAPVLGTILNRQKNYIPDWV